MCICTPYGVYSVVLSSGAHNYDKMALEIGGNHCVFVFPSYYIIADTKNFKNLSTYRHSDTMSFIKFIDRKFISVTEWSCRSMELSQIGTVTGVFCFNCFLCDSDCYTSNRQSL